MGVYTRPDSPYYWLWLERPRATALRESTGIPVEAPTAEQRKANRRLAEEVYVARIAELVRTRYALPVNRPARPFDAHARWYLETVSVTKRGLLREQSMVRQLQRFWSRFSLDEITRQHALEWRAWRLADGVKAATVNRELILLKHMLSAAVPTYLAASPIERLPELERDELEMRVLTDDEEAALLAVCDQEERALILCGLDTLQRLGTVTSFSWSDDRGDHLRVLNAKVRARAGSGYAVEVSSRLRAALDALPRVSARIFPRFYADDPQQRRNLVWRMFRKRCAAAGIPTNRLTGGASFHCLRHTGATRMLQRGVDPRTVMELGGWRRLDQVIAYVHSSREVRLAAVNRIAPRERHVSGGAVSEGSVVSSGDPDRIDSSPNSSDNPRRTA